uniref:Uncharacterized protein n=1 Tax=Tanacetum cinerariifolium TaxID=118510 RepID=A0A6L2P148_TANCI|nr:hypothetical protein [Tanacetum cinerariifolium]
MKVVNRCFGRKVFVGQEADLITPFECTWMTRCSRKSGAGVDGSGKRDFKEPSKCGRFINTARCKYIMALFNQDWLTWFCHCYNKSLVTGARERRTIKLGLKLIKQCRQKSLGENICKPIV